jgi:peptidoglycan-N-acetylglucosamine deacetylase
LSVEVSLRLPPGKDVAVCLTFDLDGDGGHGPLGIEDRLAWASDRRYGAVRGASRILQALSDRGLAATFYVPGETALLHRGLLREIADAGHAIGHHGHAHLSPSDLSEDGQREELERGLTALSEVVGRRPIGYRSPNWQITPFTLELLVEHGFAYDSSCMGDDRPYYEHGDGASILELPVHWSLGDFPYLGFNPGTVKSLVGAGEMFQIFFEEYLSARRENRRTRCIRNGPVAAIRHSPWRSFWIASAATPASGSRPTTRWLTRLIRAGSMECHMTTCEDGG